LDEVVSRSLVRICNPRPADNGFEIHTIQTKTIFIDRLFGLAYKSAVNEKTQIASLLPAGRGLQIRTSKRNPIFFQKRILSNKNSFNI